MTSEPMGRTGPESVGSSCGFTAVKVWIPTGSTKSFYFCESHSSPTGNMFSSRLITAGDSQDHKRAKTTCVNGDWPCDALEACCVHYPKSWSLWHRRRLFLLLMDLAFTAHASISSAGQRVRVTQRTRSGATPQVPPRSSEAQHLFLRDTRCTVVLVHGS